MPWVYLIPFLLSTPNILGANRSHFLFVHPQLSGVWGLSIPQPRMAEQGPATFLPAQGFAGSWGTLWLLGLELGGMGSLGQPWQFS